MIPIILALVLLFPDARLHAKLVELSGQWVARDGTDPSWKDAALDDHDWTPIQVPGNFGRYGLHGPETWARRHFLIQKGYLNQPLFLMLGNTRGNVANIYVNGRWVGRQASIVPTYQSNQTNLNGWDLPDGLLRDGDNVIAVELPWFAPNTKRDGMVDGRIYIGPRDELRGFFERAQLSREFFELGSVFFSVFAIALMGAIVVIEWSSDNRYAYIATMWLAASAGIYNTVNLGLFSVLFDLSQSAHFLLKLVTISAVVAAVFEATEHFALRRVTRMRILHRIVCALSAVVMTVLVALGNRSAAWNSYTAFAAYSLFAIVYLFATSYANLAKAPSRSAAFMTGSLSVLAFTGVAALLSDVSWIQLPSQFPLGISEVGVVASAVSTVQFLRLNRVNKELASSLKVALVRSQEATRLKSEFLANMSHELRTPLNSIVNIPDGLMDEFRKVDAAKCDACGEAFELRNGEPLPDTCPFCKAAGLHAEEQLLYEGEPIGTLDYLGMIKKSGLHLLRVVQDILDFSKLEAGKMTLEFSDVSIGKLLEELGDAMAWNARSRRATLDIAKVDPTWTLRGDPVKLLQVFVNIVSNAIKFLPEENGRVAVTVARDGDAYLFEVRDNGAGIALEHHELIFESFRQVEGGHTRKVGGSGLGLAIVRELVSGHGGLIWVKSELGKGAAFFVRLPVAAAKPVVLRRSQAPEASVSAVAS